MSILSDIIKCIKGQYAIPIVYIKNLPAQAPLTVKGTVPDVQESH